MGANINPLFSRHVDSLWAALVPNFGQVANYWPGGDSIETLEVELIWIEGVEDEEISPGRYSHVLIRNASLPAPPQQGDVIEREVGMIYDVVRVNAFAYGYGRLILHRRP